MLRDAIFLGAPASDPIEVRGVLDEIRLKVKEERHLKPLTVFANVPFTNLGMYFATSPAK